MKYIFKILMLFWLTTALCQDDAQFLKDNAIEIENLSKLHSSVYEEISSYEVIMVGEMHGTKEPAEFVYGLAKLIAEKEGKVTVGIEISENAINLKPEQINKENLLKTDFFTRENTDGRNGQTWFDLLMNCSSDSRIKVAYFDTYIEEAANRDESMYLNIKKLKETEPDTKIITLSGNVHNSLIPFEEQKTMGYYIYSDTKTFNKDKIASINHMYSAGTMMNNTGNGLELREVGPYENIYSASLDYKKYLCKLMNKRSFNYLLYTEEVNHSELISN